MGIAILSRLKIKKGEALYYNGAPDMLVNFMPEKTTQSSVCRAILVANLEFKDDIFFVSTTHFTWSEKGLPSYQQLQNLESLLKNLKSYPEIILCGDFNAPRGGVIFNKLSSLYKDNIPDFYTTSIDKNLHYAGEVNLMVDGLFSTKKYKVSDVKLISGVSDHLAITANVIL